jgi:hypothetical protein
MYIQCALSHHQKQHQLLHSWWLLSETQGWRARIKGIMSTTEEFVAWELLQQQTWPFCVLHIVLQ